MHFINKLMINLSVKGSHFLLPTLPLLPRFLSKLNILSTDPSNWKNILHLRLFVSRSEGVLVSTYLNECCI